MSDEQRVPEISIVIPTFRRRAIVTRMVRALAEQEFGEPFEVVVIVDGSDDGTADALRELEIGVPLIVREQPNRGAATARNHGASIARGEILLFLDDDMEAHPRLLEEHARSHREGADAVLGHLPLHPDAPKNFLSRSIESWAAERIERLSVPGAEPDPLELLTGQLSISRETFFAVGGFDTAFTDGGTFGNEDTEFGYRLFLRGCKVVFNPLAISWQYYAVTPRDYLRRSFQVGHADVMFARRHPEQLRTLFSLDTRERLLVRGFWRPLQRVPLLPALLARLLRRLALPMVERGMENFLATRLFREAASAAYWQGVSAGGGIPGAHPVRVLAYHALSRLPTGTVFEPYGVPPDEFAQQLDQLMKAGYHFLGVDEFLRYLRDGAGVPRRALLLTFDDAYADLSSAIPVLLERGIVAIVFVVSSRMGGTNEWDQAIGAPRLPLLDADGLKELVRNGVEIGLHSKTHPFLTRLPDSELADEIEGGGDALERHGLGRPRCFAYPYGEHDPRVREAVRQARMTAAFTVEPGRVRSGQDPFSIPRFEILRGDVGWRLRLKLAAGEYWHRVSKLIGPLLRLPRKLLRLVLRGNGALPYFRRK